MKSRHIHLSSFSITPGVNVMPSQLNVVGLLSGGKDSCYNLCHCSALGHNIVALATLAPPEGKDELDSYMYQTVGHDAIHLIAQAMELPLYRTTITGKPINQTSTYGDRLTSNVVASTSSLTLNDDHDETEDLFSLLQTVKKANPEVNAVSVGAILSNYQRVRVEHVALRVGMELLPLSFLWQRDQAELLDEMCKAEMQSILIKVAGAGLEKEDLGKTLKQMRMKLHKLNQMYGAHICGEGGEYETFTLDCPLFKRKIVIDHSKVITHGEESSDGVYYLKIDSAHLEDKSEQPSLTNVTIPNRLDKFSVQCIPKKESLKTLSLGSAKEADRVSITQTPSTSRNAHCLALGGIQGNARKDGNVESEFVEVFKTLEEMLQGQSLTLEHIAHLNIYLSNQKHFPTLNDVYKTLFGVDPPSRACVAVNLDETRCNILVDGYAFDSPSKRKALHVQGRSYWAAANIGPYSQAVEVDQRISIAGQIGLDPATLELLKDPFDQAILALQHARRIFKAILEPIRTEKKQGWIEGCVCWINDAKLIPFAQQFWLNQSQSALVDNVEDEDEWENDWLGLCAKDIPILYVVLSEDALPRRAAIEWQLSAQTGDQAMDEEDEEDDEDAKKNKPVVRSGVESFASMMVRWTSIQTKRVNPPEFGIGYLYKYQEDQSDKKSSAQLKAILESSGVKVQIFFSSPATLSSIQSAIADLSDNQVKAEITFLPILALYDNQCSQIEAAIVWQKL